MSLLNQIRKMRSDTLELNPVRWVLDMDTYRRVLKEARDWLMLTAAPQSDGLLSLPVTVVRVEREIADVTAVSASYELVVEGPKLLAIEYVDRVGLTRYVFSADTAEEFRA